MPKYTGLSIYQELVRHPRLTSCPVIMTSALRNQGTTQLREMLDGRTTVLAGLSGVGKSSLLNAVEPGLQLRTNDVSDHSHSGRHTTTQVNLLKLQSGGYVIDTPGIREFGLSGLRRGELIRFYPISAHLIVTLQSKKVVQV